MVVIKRRVTDYYRGDWGGTPIGTAATWPSGQNLPTPPSIWYPFDIKGASELHISQGNAFRKLGESRDRIGGEFHVSHRRLVNVEPSAYTYATNASQAGGSFSKRFRGRFQAAGQSLDDTSTGWPGRKTSSNAELDAFGTTAIANVEPTNPLSGLTVALGELKREGIPSIPGIQLWKDKTRLAKSAGGEYLNKEFGWDPLLGDIRNFINVSRNAEKHIEQYDRGSGRKIHRQFNLPKEITTIEESGTGYTFLYPPQQTDLMVTAPKWTRTLVTEKTRWFEGCFTYYLPPHKIGGSNLERQRRLAYKLYGAGITPEVVWDLTPWSWAIDWVSNAGDVFHNIGAFADNGLVMQYGYVMETIVHRITTTVYDIRTKSSELGGGDPSSPKRMRCSNVLESITKRRRVATPYGFGLDWDGFSPFQLSILGALGLSRRS